MEFRNILKLAMGLVAGSVMLATSAQAAPLPPVSADKAPVAVSFEPAVGSQDPVTQRNPEQVRWLPVYHHRVYHYRHWHRWKHRFDGHHHRHWPRCCLWK